MATKNPRIAVTLSDEAYGVVSRLAAAQRSSKSTVVAEVINDLAPVMAQLLETVEAAARIREENLRGVREASTEAVERMQSTVDELGDQFSLLDEIVRRGAEPPASNTGATDAPNALKSYKRAAGGSGGRK